MPTVTLCLGNTDNKLTQQRWSHYVAAIRSLVEYYGRPHFTGCSNPDAPVQNACVVFTINDAALAALRDRLPAVLRRYEQNSVAIVVGETELLASGTTFLPPTERLPMTITSHHFSDAEGNLGGGQTFGRGFAIAWQRGPLGRGEQRREPNGAFVEDIIRAALSRLEFYQESKFNCQENATAIQHLKAALASLESRTARREAEGTEGTHEV